MVFVSCGLRVRCSAAFCFKFRFVWVCGIDSDCWFGFCGDLVLVLVLLPVGCLAVTSWLVCVLELA